MRTALRAAAALAVLAGGGSAVRAQDVPSVISPLRVEADRNGVNLVSGKMTFEGPMLSVPAAPNLRFDRIQNAAPYMTGTSTSSEGDGTGSYSVHTGTGSSEAFKCIGTDCTSVIGTGSKLVAQSFREAGTGVLWHFDLRHFDKLVNSTRTMQYYASQVEYPNGERIDYSYDTYVSGDFLNRTYYRPTTITSNLGYAISITYQGSSFGTIQWDLPSVVTLYRTSDPSTPLGRLTFSGATITDLGGRTYTCAVCANNLGLPIEVASGSLQLPNESAAAVQANAHPSAPLVASVVRDGVTWTYSYANPRLYAPSNAWRYDQVTVDGPDDYHQVYSISGLGALAAQRNVISAVTDPNGRTTEFQYDAAYRPTRMILPEKNEVRVEYDNFGNITARTAIAKPGTGLAEAREIAFYPSETCGTAGLPILCYRRNWSRDALGRQTDYAYNGRGQLIEQTDPADADGVRRKTFVTYEEGMLSRRSVVRTCGTGAACGTAGEIRTEYVYWESTFLPLIERRIDSARGITLETNYGYDGAGRPVFVDGPAAGTDDAAYFRYDVWGRKTWEIGPRGANGLRPARRFYYRDSDDRLTASEDGTVPSSDSTTLTLITRTDLAYDPHRNPAREKVSAGGTTYAVTDKSWDGRGRLVCAATRMNKAAFAAQPGACELGQEGLEGPDRITHNMYDPAGQLTSVERAYRTPLQQFHARYEYTLNGKQKAVIDANGNRAEMAWDGLDRQSRWTFPSKTTPGAVNAGDYEEYGWDAAGNRLTLRKRDGKTIGYEYDSLNRLTRKTVPASASGAAGYVVVYGYDLRGLQTFARFGSATGSGVANAWDALGRLASSSSDMDGTLRTLTYGYDAHGNRISMLGSGAGGYEASFEYDSGDRMVAVREGGGAMVARFGFDSAGRRSSLGMGPAGTVTSSAGYEYDPVSRLETLTRDLPGTASDQTLTFGYNSASQIVARANTNDSYASTATVLTQAYAINGLNQYTQVGSSGFVYDANGNLQTDGSTTLVYDSENRLVSASGFRNATLAYDPLGRLWQVSSAAGTTRFRYDGDRLIEEYNAAGTRLRAYVHGPGADEPLVRYELTGGPMRRFYHADHQGSIVAEVDEAGSAARNGYDAWGVPNPGNQSRFQYTGQAWIPELGMYYYKARFYTPTIGRFIQVDPVGYDDQINLYAYVGNDPANFSDPAGFARICTSVIGSRLPACVYADANGDGNSRDRDLSSGNAESLGDHFHGFIQTHNGEDIGKSGAQIGSGFTAGEEALVRATSQFIGANIRGGWGNTVLYGGGERRWVNGTGGPLSRDTAAATEGVGSGRFVTYLNMNFKDHRTNPSSLARTMIHDLIHTKPGYASAANAVELRVDALARHYLKAWGLGRGGCPAVGGFFGLFERYPAC